MITGASLCPSPPLLCAQLTGRTGVLTELRAACAQTVGRLLGEDPELVVIIGPADATGAWDADSRLNPALFAPAIGATATNSPPPALGLGAMLLDQAGYRGRRIVQAVSQDEPAGACVALGAELADAGDRRALLVMGDGTARRSPKAPGYLDSRAVIFDAEVERAVRSGDIAALTRLDQALARDLMVTGRGAWQVLAGAIGPLAPAAEILYSADPYGVAYLVAYLSLDRSEDRGDCNP